MERKLFSLKSIIFRVIGAFGFCILIVFLYNAYSCDRLLNDMITDHLELYANHVLQSAGKNLSDIQETAASLARNPYVLQYLNGAGTDSDSYRQIIRLFHTARSLNSSIMDIGLIDEAGNSVGFIGEASLYRSLYNTASRNGGSSLSFLGKSALTAESTEYEGQIAALPVRTAASSEAIGVLFLTVNFSSILGDGSGGNGSASAELVYVNSSRQLILGREELYKEIKRAEPLSDTFKISHDNRHYICRRFRLDIADGTIYALENRSVYTRKTAAVLLPQLLFILTAFFTIAVMLRGFSELEMNKRKIELAYLQNQINPHFLYNTFTLISGMASEGNSKGIIDITEALAQIYRYSIGSDMVTVRQELEIIKAYVIIQMTRFENRFDVNYDIAENVLDAVIPRMIVQPLVENAVKHGLEKCLRKGSLTIGGKRNATDNTLVLWVYDTGVGMSGERLSYIRKILRESVYDLESDSSKALELRLENNIGLFNVNRRINLYYGDPYRLHVDSEENVGTNIQIKIPFHTDRSTVGAKS